MELSNNYADRPHVLVIDDDARIRDLVSRFLKDNGFVAMTARDAANARELLRSFEFDVLVVDVMMPGETGMEFINDFRKKFSTPAILLTALGEPEDRIKGLESGADDYLPKPFEPRELVLRLNAILRRAASRRDAGKPLKIGRWIFSAEPGELRDGKKAVALTEAEVRLINALAARPGETVSREELAKKCGLESDGRAIDVQVTRLRKKLGEGKNPRYLLTARGKGYMLRVGEE